MATLEELKARVEELGLPVTPTGEGGKVLKADYELALEEAGAAAPPSSASDEGTKTFIVRGPYKVFGKPRGQEVTGEIKVHDDSGGRIIVVGAEWANLDALLESGWLEEKGA